MPAAAEERLVRRPMSLQQFHALPDDVRAEYVDGEAVMSPSASMPHNEIGLRIILVLRQALPHLHVGYELGLRMAPTKWRIPDVAVVDRIESVRWTDQVPVLAVELDDAHPTGGVDVAGHGMVDLDLTTLLDL